ncbi:MAG: hypothetical protein AAF639_04235 [Chloroflexota bacterium]
MAENSGKENLNNWLWKAPLGLTIIGLGASLLGESIIAKAKNKPAYNWFLAGTISLIVFNAGISLFGDAVKERALYEARK